MVTTSPRTFVCSVLFLDIVEYSKKSVSEQQSFKARFNALLQMALQHLANSERIVVDTGDGAAIAFLGNPEESLFAAMSIRDALNEENAEGDHGFLIRIGINLGPVRLIKDFNGQQNMIGDGINVAQRVMSFAEPGQVLVSRSYYEVVSCLSDDYAKLFEFDGTRKDKHVREHSVYTIGASIPGVGPAPPKRETSRFHLSVVDLKKIGSANFHVPKLPKWHLPKLRMPQWHLPQWHIPASWMRRVPNKRQSLLAVGGATLVLAIIGLWLTLGNEAPAPTTDKAPLLAVPTTTTLLTTSAESESPVTAVETAPTAIETPKPVADGQVRFAVLPWGEVYIDGKRKGSTPPIKSLKLPPGKYTIEVRNGDAAPYIEKLDLAPGKIVTIRHLF